MNNIKSAVVIGAGITGVLTAWRLAEEGHTVTLLEAQHLGAGSSSRTAAGIRQQFSTPESVKSMRYSVAKYREFAQTVGIEEPVLVQNGYLFLYGDDEAFEASKQRVEMQQRAGLTEVESLNAHQLVQRFPWLAEGSFAGGSFCPTDGFLLPSVIYQEGANFAKSLGVKFHHKAPVVDSTIADGKLISVKTPKGEFSADIFIDCTNAWSNRLASTIGGAQLNIDPIKRYLWFIERAGSMSSNELLKMPLTILPNGIYLRPENSDTLQVGWAHQATPEPNFSYEDQDTIEAEFSHQGDISSRPFAAWMEIAEAVPAIEEFAGLAATTSGFYAVSPDHNPYLGYDPNLSNLIRLVGFSGHGAMFGPFTAEVGVALAEAGCNLSQISLHGEVISLGAFAIDREFENAESMVI